MGTVLLYVYFAVSVMLVLIGLTDFVRVSRNVQAPDNNGVATPKWLPVFVFCLGCLGVLSSAPSIFSDNPHWFVDRIYSLVSSVIDAFR